VIAASAAVNPSPALPLINPSAIHSYTAKRALEYWTWRRHQATAAALQNGQRPPPYTTAHRHCPCGHPRHSAPAPSVTNIPSTADRSFGPVPRVTPASERSELFIKYVSKIWFALSKRDGAAGGLTGLDWVRNERDLCNRQQHRWCKRGAG
jgi:hypothetical protein